MLSPARPLKPARSIFHVLAGVVSLWFALDVFEPGELVWVAGSISATFWALEALRRPYPRFNQLLMFVFRPIAHAQERHNINSATWFMAALTLLALTRSPMVCVVGVAVLAFADPAASLVGRRFGRVTLSGGRTLEGTLGFVVVGTVAAAVALQLLTPRPSLAFSVSLAFAATAAAAIAELLSWRIDDNFTIPVAAGAATAAVLSIAPAV